MVDFNPTVDPYLKENLLLNPQWKKGFARLAHYGLSFDLQLNPHQFEDAAKVIRHSGPRLNLAGFFFL